MLAGREQAIHSARDRDHGRGKRAKTTAQLGDIQDRAKALCEALDRLSQQIDRQYGERVRQGDCGPFWGEAIQAWMDAADCVRRVLAEVAGGISVQEELVEEAKSKVSAVAHYEPLISDFLEGYQEFHEELAEQWPLDEATGVYMRESPERRELRARVDLLNGHLKPLGLRIAIVAHGKHRRLVLAPCVGADQEGQETVEVTVSQPFFALTVPSEVGR